MKTLRFAIASDLHGNEQNTPLVEKFFDWMEDFKPDICLAGGDLWNFAALRKKASQDEKREAIAPDYEAGKEFAERFFRYGRQRVLLRGNHDERIYSLARTGDDAVSKEYAVKLAREIDVLMRKLKVRMLPYDSRLGVLDIEGIRAIHGYAAGVGAARKFAQIYGTCVFGHTHSMDVAPVEAFPEPSIAYGTGCMCHIDQPYNSTQPGKLRHENGWIYGHTDGHRATYFQAKYKDGKVYAAETIKEY